MKPIKEKVEKENGEICMKKNWRESTENYFKDHRKKVESENRYIPTIEDYHQYFYTHHFRKYEEKVGKIKEKKKRILQKKTFSTICTFSICKETATNNDQNFKASTL